MLNNKKAFQLSINMIVVMILGLALLGVGFSIFYSAYNQTVNIKERVDSQTQQQLNELLDTGEAIVIPINSKDGDRGDYVDFDIGISNELGQTRTFFFYVRFDRFVGSDIDVNNDVTSSLYARDIADNSGSGITSCRSQTDDEKTCADNWILFSREDDTTDLGYESDKFALEANARHTIPLRIVLPKKIEINGQSRGLPSGQYIFNVDIYSSNIPNFNCKNSLGVEDECPRYFSKKKLYIKVT